MSEIVLTAGYPIEEHFVRTDDGYILGLFRIRNGVNSRKSGYFRQNNINRPVVLLMHGLLDSSMVFVNNLPQNSLAFVLADAGWDVFIGNCRGNAFSTAHEFLSVDSKEFWDFSYDEMAKYDLPAIVDEVLRISSQDGANKVETITYVGHSQGSTIMFAAQSMKETRDKLKGKISHFVGLGPVTFVSNTKSILLKLLAEMDMDKLVQIIGVHDFAPSNEIFKVLLPAACEKLNSMCNTLLESVYGVSTHLNSSRIDVYLSHFPSGTSTKNIIKWAQGVRHGKFRMFDYGKEENIKKYNGLSSPPEYDLKSFPNDLRTTIFHGSNDALATPFDTEIMIKSLNPKSLVDDIQIPEYAHVDFVWGIDSKEKVNKDLLQLMKENETSISKENTFSLYNLWQYVTK